MQKAPVEPSVAGQAHLPAEDTVAGSTVAYVFVGLWQGCIGEISVHGTVEAAEAAFQKFAEVPYSERNDDVNEDAKWKGSDIEPQQLRIRECETPDCLDFTIADINLPEYHCLQHTVVGA